MTHIELEKKLKTYRLTALEYEKICELLGRPPQGVEWALFSALWSEHCSYKSSRVHLKKIYRQAPWVVQSMGENAGIIDLGQGERIAFKMESHNHPSFIEPYQGAMTGVGGILRDIFTMGARPIALANYLCFGNPRAPRMPSLVDGVVRGIGDYGNCVGVPTVTGQTEFHESYNQNILVNAMAVGYFGPNDPICISKAQGVGNWVVYVGAKTGRDGIHGASMASTSFAEDSKSQRPTVQMGDPFFEKLLIESCLEVMKKGLVVAIQDMGAAGLISSSFEMASKGQVGMILNLDQVPLRDSSLGPEEILLSESQERMLLVCEPQKFCELKSVFEFWGLDATCIGEIIAERKMKLFWKGELLTNIDPDLLVEKAPSYERPSHPLVLRGDGPVPVVKVDSVEDGNKKLLDVLSDVRGCARHWIYRQYDQRVGTRTCWDASHSIAVLRLDLSQRSLGLVVGCRPHVMRLDAQIGGVDAVAYPCLQLAAKGFRALALTDCLNFGNPENPQIMSEFVTSLRALSQMCEALEVPIISGNVSFYNETQGENITSTPSTGVVGLKESNSPWPQDHFTNEGEKIYLLSLPQIIFAGLIRDESKALLGKAEMNLTEIAHFIKFVRELCGKNLISSSRVVGKFGLAYSLARMSLNRVGAKIHLPTEVVPNLFCETLYQVIVTVASQKVAEFEAISLPPSFKKYFLGTTGASHLKIEPYIDLSITDMAQAYNFGWEKAFETLA